MGDFRDDTGEHSSENFLPNLSGMLNEITGGIPVTDTVSLSPVDIGAIMLSTGEAYTGVFNQVFLERADRLITGTTRDPFFQIGGINSAQDTAARFKGAATTLKKAGIALALAGTGLEALREWEGDNVAGAVREAATGGTALAGSLLVGGIIAPVASTVAASVIASAGVTATTAVAVAATAAVVITTAGVAIAITTYSDNNASVVEDIIIANAEDVAPYLGFQYDNNPQTLINNIISALPEHDVILGTDMNNIADLLNSTEQYPSLSPNLTATTDHIPGGCFLAGTPVSMWDGTEKPIEEVRAGDLVTSYDEKGNLVSKPVTRTMTHSVKYIMDVHGLMVTPGHVTLCGDGRFAGQHVPIIDILRSDGALVKEDGTRIRASTNEPVGSARDQFVHTIAVEHLPDGSMKAREQGKIRLGTKHITETNHIVCVAEIIEDLGGTVTPDGLIVRKDDGEHVPLLWPYGDRLPRPEDYVLQRSHLTLNHIYAADEWEAVQPQMPAPPTGEGAPVNAPEGMMATPVSSAPITKSKAVPAGSSMTRQQRRAAQAKQRKSAKGRKRVAS